MKIYVEHRKISGKFSLNRAINNVACSTGGTLLLKSLKDQVSRQLSPFGIDKLDFMDIGEQEILVCPDGKALASIYLLRRGDQRYLQTVIIFDKDNAKNGITKLINEIPQVEKATTGSVRDALQVRRLEKILAKLSPNGQKLADSHFQSILPKLYDLKTREIVRDFFETYGDIIVPIFLLKKSESLTKNLGVFNRVLSDAELFTRKYAIACQNCEEYMIPLLYESIEAAQGVLNASVKSECPLCHKSLSVTDALSLQDIARQGIEQGLWLEHLVYSVAKEKAVAAFAGRIYGLHEVDVVAVLGEETILFECKDTSVGHNDPIITAGKAQAIRASRVFTITTKHIHENVKVAVEQLGRPSRRGFQIEQAEEATEIQKKVRSFLEDIEKNYIRQILAERESSISERLRYMSAYRHSLE